MVTEPNLHDASHMRALAHPTRLRLLGLLRELGPRTAAQLSEQVDEAAGTLSYHLRKLAAAGFIQEVADAGSDRRERWWQAVHVVTAWDDTEVSRDPAKLSAVREMARTLGAFYAQQYDQYLSTTPDLPEAWVRAGVSGDRRLDLTSTQMQELHDELEALEQKWDAISAAQASDAETAAVFFHVQAYRRPE